MTNYLLASEPDLFLCGEDFSTHQSRVSIHIVAATGIVLMSLVLALGIGKAESLVSIVLAAGCVSYLLITQPRRKIHREAEKIRRQLELATAVFLDLVNVLLAGGAGIETSVVAAANAGDGRGFSLIRLAVMRAQSARMSYWDSLAEVGETSGVPTLIEVAHTVRLAGEHGARIRYSLVSKAVALRKRNLAQLEHDEEQRTEKIGLPLVVLFLGFLLLIGYPAFTQTMASL